MMYDSNCELVPSLKKFFIFSFFMLCHWEQQFMGKTLRLSNDFVFTAFLFLLSLFLIVAGKYTSVFIGLFFVVYDGTI